MLLTDELFLDPQARVPERSASTSEALEDYEFTYIIHITLEHTYHTGPISVPSRQESALETELHAQP